MRAVIQRVTQAQVFVGTELVGEIGPGFLILLGVGEGDTQADAAYLAEKTVNLRVFEDSEGKMNRSLLEVSGEALVVSQFTLYGDCRKGRRPSFSQAADPQLGERLYQAYCDLIKGYGINVQQGRFRAYMQVKLVNDGPVTLLLDSRRGF
ncbi:MAG TPA: D-tyrosyl-tRNA(Tyr) deacylase [Firmicutes bacterium]|jgi:D-tyrosyl-tRNA(Tyr) deacylase|nr:D-tyrosyl-tRNA(Tyr) deacylase [Bacillota bacterium]HOQ23129.1 D-aminoacyl-tRNA deacylase [Bacillota bacterium]HPT67026.1 D-aminoacyl-tRNA deacylase [Bacillota bacterium]